MTRLLRWRTGPCGVTAVELITLVVLLVILAAFAIPGMSPVVLRYRVRGAAWQVAGDLRLARQRAVTVKTRFRVCVTSCAISLPPGSYSIERDNGGMWVSDTGAPTRLPPNVQITANNTPVFQANGMVSPMATFTVSSVLSSYEIRVASTGRVRVCPAGSCSE